MPALPTTTLSGWFTTGWETYRKHFVILVSANIIQELIVLPASTRPFTSEAPGRAVLFVLWMIFVATVLGAGWLYLCLKAVRDENPRIGTMFSSFRRYGAVWAASMLSLLAVMGGMILLVIPGIIFATRFAFSPLAAMDKKTAGPKSLIFSSQISQGFRNKILAGGIIYLFLEIITTRLFIDHVQYPEKYQNVGLWIVGAILYIVDIIIVTPWMSSSFAAAYHSLASLNGNPAQSTETDVA